MTRHTLFSLSTLLLITLACKPKATEEETLHALATAYVETGLTIGHYDSDFVDAYYGPDSLKPVDLPEFASFPKDFLLAKTDSLKKEFEKFMNRKNLILEHQLRARYILAQLKAAEERIRIVSGETTDFDSESLALFGVKAPTYDISHFQAVIDQLENILPGEGSLQEKYQDLTARFVIPENKLDTVFKTAIAKARNETKAHYPIPENENFTLEYESDKPWSGYNWYKGNYTSLIQINIDYPINISRVLDVGSHESYPGHHVYNMLLEENLYNKKGYIETSLYPLFSPQSFIAEGSANYGIELAFLGQKKAQFAKEVLLPLAELDTTGIDTYFKALALVSELNYAGNEVARGLFSGEMSENEGIEYLIKYGFYSPEKAKQRIAFTKKYRSYVINYNYGKDLIANYIESNGGTAEQAEKRWEVFGQLLSNQILPVDLLKE
ncbi:hypothetical protein LAG90_19330 [Marinilongibacter aquaticus]|uniref:hypothetical protein n=1 Tax=Marinilongibacter aquaticus TaxID=2975157 RepID=UPI0021BD1066|nr:hypothetical protein [Marinilongibacter aquaticus]UBM58954.1 hypothetical protein LAG90_19330 [Marinilongibacter aquaticus]